MNNSMDRRSDILFTFYKLTENELSYFKTKLRRETNNPNTSAENADRVTNHYSSVNTRPYIKQESIHQNYYQQYNVNQNQTNTGRIEPPRSPAFNKNPVSTRIEPLRRPALKLNKNPASTGDERVTPSSSDSAIERAGSAGSDTNNSFGNSISNNNSNSNINGTEPKPKLVDRQNVAAASGIVTILAFMMVLYIPAMVSNKKNGQDDTFVVMCIILGLLLFVLVILFVFLVINHHKK